MTVPVACVQLKEEELVFKKLEGLGWIREDARLRFKLREIAARYVEVRRFVAVKRVDEEKNIAHLIQLIDSSEKRRRTTSEDSIIEGKQLRKIIETPEKEPDLPSVTSNEWECKKCTFLNSAESKTSCAICGSFKPRSDESSGPKQAAKRDHQVETYIKGKICDSSPRKAPQINRKEDPYAEILSRGVGGVREHQLTGASSSSSSPADCTVYTSPYNLLVCGQAQEESTWINALEKDVFAQHNLDEELLFTKRYLAAKRMNRPEPPSDEARSPLTPSEVELLETQILSDYSTACNVIIGVSFPNISYISNLQRLSWDDWKASGVHTEEFLSRLQVIHEELCKDAIKHYDSIHDVLMSVPDCELLLKDEIIGRRIIDKLLNEPRCDLNLHCLSHVEGDNMMDRFLIPAAMQRADLIYTALVDVWTNRDKTGFIAARPPGHHCPSFEDRLIGLNPTTSFTNDAPSSCSLTKLEKEICRANGLTGPPREHGMGFCALNALAVAVKRFLQIHNPPFEQRNGRSIRLAILDLDIHAGNGTELVFRDSRSVLHVSFHRYGWLSNGESGSERVMPGTHYYKDVGGIFGKNNKRPKGEGYAVNVTLRKGDGNAEALSAFEGVALPIMKEFSPDVVVVACGFDGLKLSSVFKNRWGEESCPGMDAEYTPSLFGYIVNRVRAEVQSRVIAATEGGYDPLSVGLAARSVAKALKGSPIPKPPVRVFNSDWLSQLNNIFQLQRSFWNCLG
jgi:acetoin utilization deacetylase AcuC-like enzyme